jgi:hypothetical protein
MSLVGQIIDIVKEKVSSSEDQTDIAFLEGYDPRNRKIQAIKTGKKYSVKIDEYTIECSSKKDAELEFEFRINDTNKNL